MVYSVFILLLAALGLCFEKAFSSCSKQGLLSSCVRASRCGGFSYCGARALGCVGLGRCGTCAPECGLNGCGAWASLPHGVWNLLRPGIEPVSPASAGDSLLQDHQGKSLGFFLR